MGTAGIAHGAADVSHPAEQGLMGIMEVFLDTIVICTMTALVILCSGVPIPYGKAPEGDLTALAFGVIWGDWVKIFLAGAMCCFAFGTVLGWGLYGARCAQFLFGAGSWKWFALGQTGVVFLGALLKSGTVWSLAETVNGLMAVPNLLALLMLRKEVVALTADYENNRRNRPGSQGFFLESLDKKTCKMIIYPCCDERKE